MPPLAMDRFLVPADAPAPPDGFQRLRQPLTRGVPFSFALDGELSLVLILPTGVATLWRDLDPGTVIASSDAELAPHAPPRGTDPLAVPPLRLLLRRGSNLLAALPLAAGLARVAPDGDGAASTVELVLLAWTLHAGCVRGAGEFGSFVELAWRRVGAGRNAFDLPPLDPHVAARHTDEVQSQTGIPGATTRPRGGYLP
jgi:hypothetical protein